MTAYTDPATMSTISGAPATEALMTALKLNPVAITEGSSGAPKVQPAALDSTVLVINGASWGGVQSVAPGNTSVLALGVYAVGWQFDSTVPAASGPQLKINGSWVDAHFGTLDVGGANDAYGSVIVISDGVNCRINVPAAGSTVYYHKVL